MTFHSEIENSRKNPFKLIEVDDNCTITIIAAAIITKTPELRLFHFTTTASSSSSSTLHDFHVLECMYVCSDVCIDVDMNVCGEEKRRTIGAAGGSSSG